MTASRVGLSLEAFRPCALSFVLDADGWSVAPAPDPAWIEAQLALTDADIFERHLQLVPALPVRAAVKPSKRGRHGWRRVAS